MEQQPAHTTALLQPAENRFVYARDHVVDRHAGTMRLLIKPNARGRRLVHHHTYPVVLRLWVTYTPTGAAPRSLGFHGLYLTQESGSTA